MLVFRNISYQLKGKPILRDVSWHVEPGLITALLGPNGSGKTTLLRILSGEIPATSGELLLDKKPVKEWSPDTLARSRAVLPQSFHLTFDFTVEEVVRMGRLPHTQDGEKPTDVAICEEALRKVGMFEMSHRIYTTLSGGEQQRVQLARVLAQIWPDEVHTDKRFLFLDEPTSNLDLEQQHATLKIAHTLVYKNVGVFVVLHDLNLAMKYADEVILLDEGDLVAAGKVNDVLTADNIEKVFNMRATFLENPYDEERPWLVTAPR